MKFCLTNNLSHEYLQKADEIKVPYKDRNKIIDYVEKYPEATIILDMKKTNEIINWQEIQRYSRMTKNNFIIALNNLSDVKQSKKVGVKFYWNFPVTSFYDLRGLQLLGAEYALIDSPLVQDIERAAQVGIKLRVVPNVAYYAYIPRVDGVCGSWIRPEDLELYDPYIAAVEFEDGDTKKEQALYRIYAEQRAWSGDLGIIITNLNYPGVNRMIPRDLTRYRMNCGQSCMNGSHCKLCYRYLNLANPDSLREIKRNT